MHYVWYSYKYKVLQKKLAGGFIKCEESRCKMSD